MTTVLFELRCDNRRVASVAPGLHVTKVLDHEGSGHTYMLIATVVY